MTEKQDIVQFMDIRVGDRVCPIRNTHVLHRSVGVVESIWLSTPMVGHRRVKFSVVFPHNRVDNYRLALERDDIAPVDQRYENFRASALRAVVAGRRAEAMRELIRSNRASLEADQQTISLWGA